MGNRIGQAYALMVMTPVCDGHERLLLDDLEALPGGADSPLSRTGTTHFARWLVLHDLVYQGPPQQPDGLSRPYLLFSSTFDGELLPYLDALLTTMPVESDRVWGHCIGYPGTADPEAFRGYLQHNQIETSFFFSAYAHATVTQVLAGLELRDLLTATAIEVQGRPAAEVRRLVRDRLGVGR